MDPKGGTVGFVFRTLSIMYISPKRNICKNLTNWCIVFLIQFLVFHKGR
jgi:hypothetical protein